MARLLRSTTQSKLRAPIVLGPSNQFRPVQVKLVRGHGPPPTRYSIGAPVVVAPPIVFRPLSRTLVAVRAGTEQRRHGGKGNLRPPTVLGASVVFRALKLALVTARHPIPTRSVLRPPTVITAAGVQEIPRPLAVKLAPSPEQARTPRTSRLDPPAVLIFPVDTTPFRPLLVRLARWFPVRLTKYSLGAPVEVAAPFVAGASALPRKLQVKLVQLAPMSRRTRSKLGQPSIVDAAAPVDTGPTDLFLNPEFSPFRDTGGGHWADELWDDGSPPSERFKK